MSCARLSSVLTPIPPPASSPKPVWLAILGGGALLRVGPRVSDGTSPGAVAAGIYLVDVRPKILEIQGKVALTVCVLIAAATACCRAGAGPERHAARRKSVPSRRIEHVEWAKWGDLSSLQVFPTESGRLAAGQLGTHAQADEAWGESRGALRRTPT